MSSRKLESRFRVFGQICHIVATYDGDSSQDPIEAAKLEFQRLERKFYSRDRGSVIGLINQRAGSGESTPLDAESRSLFDYSRVLWEESSHLFDPTTGQLQHFYNDKNGQNPSLRGLSSEVSLVGWPKLDLSDSGAHLGDEGMSLDLDSCVRPYSVDSVRKLLAKMGIKSALIDLGKDVATIGKQADGANWLVGMRYPDGLGTAIERFKLNNKGYAIRGDFKRALSFNGERFSRSLSPIDGHPIPGLLGVAVIADSCHTACSAASIARFKTEENALKWLDNIGLPWLAIDRKLKCHGPLSRAG